MTKRHLSFTAISAFLDCEKKYWYKYVHRIEPAYKSDNLTLGAAFQKGVELQSPALAEDEVPVTLFKQQTEIHRATINAAVTAYLKKWPVDVHEIPLEAPIINPANGKPHPTFRLIGYVDGLLTGDNTYIENKFTSWPDGYHKDKDLSLQILLYMLLLRRNDKPFRGFRLRTVRKPQLRRKKDESVVDFCQRIRDDYETRQDFYLQESFIDPVPARLNDLETNLWIWANQITALERREAQTRNYGSCNKYGGCEFRDICLMKGNLGHKYKPKGDRHGK